MLASLPFPPATFFCCALPSDDKQWLTFWLLYSIFDLAQAILNYVAFAIPFYHEAKLGFVIFLGVFGGASMIYPAVEPILLKADEVAKKYENEAKMNEYKGKIDSKINEAKNKLG